MAVLGRVGGLSSSSAFLAGHNLLGQALGVQQLTKRIVFDDRQALKTTVQTKDSQSSEIETDGYTRIAGLNFG